MTMVLNGLFVLLIGVVVAAAAAMRPSRGGGMGSEAGGAAGAGSTSPQGEMAHSGRSRQLTLAIWFVIGLVIGLVLLSTNTLYQSGKW